MDSLRADAETILDRRGGVDARPGAARRLAQFVLRLTDVVTNYEGRDGYALVDKAAYDALRAENALLRSLTPSSNLD